MTTTEFTASFTDGVVIGLKEVKFKLWNKAFLLFENEGLVCVVVSFHLILLYISIIFECFHGDGWFVS